MSEHGAPGQARRRRRSFGVLVSVCVALLLAAVPGTAAAAPGGVTPVIHCQTANADGTYTVVFGYTNDGTEVRTLRLGSENSLTPSRFQGIQPTSFAPGTRRGVFSLTMTRGELSSKTGWDLDGNSVKYSPSWVPTCSPSTPLPALGNGTGLAIALVAGGAFGVLYVRRLIRRASASA